jgi:hypothetical protein
MQFVLEGIPMPVQRRLDDVVIVRRSSVDLLGGDDVELFAVTYPGVDDIGTECDTRADADAKAAVRARKEQVSVWYDARTGDGYIEFVSSHRT